jgi:hypothetical protein
MKGRWIPIGVLILGLVFALAVGVILAQGPESEDDVSAGEVEPAAVSGVVPIQGRLTDASGNPLDGNYSVTASIYDVSTGGTALCTDADTVAVDNGLFNMDMHGCTASDIDGEQLYLGIQVGSDPEMTPRQPFYPVPYAWTVKPGAIIRGGTTYLFTPGSAFVRENSSDSTRWDLSGAAARIYRGANAGIKYIRIPITIPSVLYGRDVRVTHVRVYYQCENGANNYISRTTLFKMTDADSAEILVDDTTDRTSNSATNYSLVTDSNYNTLSSSQGSLALLFQLDFANDTEYVQIGGVRLNLVTNY